jgi:hypothetical protein
MFSSPRPSSDFSFDPPPHTMYIYKLPARQALSIGGDITHCSRWLSKIRFWISHPHNELSLLLAIYHITSAWLMPQIKWRIYHMSSTVHNMIWWDELWRKRLQMSCRMERLLPFWGLFKSTRQRGIGITTCCCFFIFTITRGDRWRV